MAIIPIFIHIHEETDEQRRRRWAREDELRDREREEERREEEKLRQERLRKEEEKRQREKRLNDEYYKMKNENPWDFMILPEGWSIFGQTNIQVLPFE